MFGGDFETAGDMMGYQFLHIGMGSLVQIVICIPVQEQVVADTATDKRTLDFRHSVHFFVYIQQRCVICIQILADDRRDARRFLALGADIRILPFHPVHVGRRATEVAQVSFEVRHSGDLFHFFQYGLFTS